MQKVAKLNTLIVGATGQLGSLITWHALKQPNLAVSILIRNPDKSKTLCDQVKALGGQIIVADTSKPETLKNSTKGIHTIVSALIGDDKTVLEGQRALLKDAEANGVARFLPSDYSLDFRKMKPEEHDMLAQRIHFRADLQKSKVKGISVFNGGFMETFWYFQGKYQQPGQPFTVGCFGNANIKTDYTSYDDTAKFVAALVNDPTAVGDQEIIGETLTFQQVADVYKKVTGKESRIVVYGTLADLVKARDEAKASGDFLRYIWLAYTVPIVDGRGQLHKPSHKKYGIKTTTMEDFLKSRPDLYI